MGSEMCIRDRLNIVWPFSYSYAQNIGESIQISDEKAIFDNVNVFNELIDFKISQDGSTVIYRAYENGVFSRELFSVPITGGTPVRVNATLPTNGQISLDFEISPDSSTVVYRGTQNNINNTEIFSVPITGGTPIPLNPNFVSIGSDVISFQISPDGSNVVYLADQMDNVVEVFSVPIEGGTVITLNGALTTDGFGGDVQDFKISPDGTHVVYLADQITDGFIELFSVPINGGTAVRLNLSLIHI